MSALAIPAPATAVGPRREPRKRGHLQLVGPDYVPANPQRRPQGPAGPAAQRSAVRLTARGRMVRSLVSLAVGTAMAVGVGGWLGTVGAQEHTGPVDRVSVAVGDTLWAIAAASAGAGQDVRDVVDEIIEINGLGSAQIAVGQQLLVPAG